MKPSLLVGVAFSVYLLAMILIGITAYRRTTDLSDYVLGGRRLGAWVAALSAGASDMSGWLLLGLPGYVYASGLEGGWIALGLLAGTYLNWRVVADRLRRYTLHVGDALTLPEYFSRRFGDFSRLLRVTSALFILLFFVFYTTSGLVAGGKLFNGVFGIPYHWAVLAGLLSIVVYTLLGGFLAVCWTDVVQALLMLFALVAVPLLTFELEGGLLAVIEAVQRIDPARLDPLSAASGEPLSALALMSLLAWGLGYFGQPHILARFMALRSSTRVRWARRIGTGWAALAMLGALAVGLAGIPLFPDPLADPEKVFIRAVQVLLHPFFAGVCLAAILAAIMSTADSQLLVAASALTEDFYRALLRRGAGQKELVWVGRLTVLGVGVVACLLALDPRSGVLDLVAYAWAGFGAAFGPAVILSLLWRRMTGRGALAGILAGGTTVVVWARLDGGLFELYEMVPGFLIASLAVVAVSLLGPPPDKETLAAFDHVRLASGPDSGQSSARWDRLSEPPDGPTP